MKKLQVLAVVIVLLLSAPLLWKSIAPKAVPALDVNPEVWSENSPRGETYEFKVNCFGSYPRLEACFLYELDAVRVMDPKGRTYHLNKDFNVNSYSGEVTRRWVLYGEVAAGLPPSGRYVFEFIKDGEVVSTKTVDYLQSSISYPTDVTWRREGKDLHVEWLPPEGVRRGMWYKVLVWNEPGTPELFISDTFEWDARTAVMRDVPLVDGGSYSLNVAVYFDEGYAYSEYVILSW